MLSKITYLFLLLLSNVSFAAEPLIDPTMPKGYLPSADGQLSTSQGNADIVLSAVFIRGQNRYAVLNGDTVAQGESWKGFTVIEVNANRVILQSQDNRQEILVNPQPIKKDVANDF